MKTFEVSVGIGTPLIYYKADSEEEVVEFINQEYPNLKRWNTLTTEQRRADIDNGQAMNHYFVHELRPEVLERTIDDYQKWIEKLTNDKAEAEKFLKQLT